MKKTISAIKISAARRVDAVTIPNKLEAFQGYVDGYIEVAPCARLQKLGAVMIVNEEGVINSLRHNKIASRIACTPIFGNAIIVGADGENFTDIPEKAKAVVMASVRS